MAVADGGGNKIIFTSHAGTNWFNRIPFRLTIALATNQSAPDMILNKYTLKSCLVYLYNIIIYSKSCDHNLIDIEGNRATYYTTDLLLELERCHWLIIKVEYLGHTINPHKHRITEAHTKSFEDIMHLRALSDLWPFFGMWYVYWCFVLNYFCIAVPLYQHIQMGQAHHLAPLTDEQAHESKTLAEAVNAPPILSLPRLGCLTR